MQLNHKLVTLACALVFSVASVVRGTPTSDVTTVNASTDGNTAVSIMTVDEMMNWLATTDADLTFIGDPINPLAPRAPRITILTYCNLRVQGVCGGSCQVYTGGPVCLAAPGTSCLGATTNVGYCTTAGCVGTCNELASCGIQMDNGFCATPGTVSILVPVNTGMAV
ncbi:hypothetical protein C8Q76DRAFT_855926 [Earliella scabrosa]|nr:hypothetical protein C8Q76DRAFT_855926 [Earliella scabrosa]